MDSEYLAMHSHPLPLPSTGSSPWLLYPCVLLIQLSSFLVGLHGALAYCSLLSSGAFLLSLVLQPLRLPHVTNTLTALLAAMSVLRLVAEEAWATPDSLHFNRGQRFRAVLCTSSFTHLTTIMDTERKHFGLE